MKNESNWLVWFLLAMFGMMEFFTVLEVIKINDRLDGLETSNEGLQRVNVAAESKDVAQLTLSQKLLDHIEYLTKEVRRLKAQ